MATILLSAGGAALGGGIGGSVAGLSNVAIGRAVGATLGRVIDQKLLGSGSEPVETGRVDRFRLSQAGEGAPIAQVFGRMRVGGQVIWASDFQETRAVSGGGKGAPRPKTTTFSYTVSLAIAVCSGVIAGIGRVWADGEEIGPGELNLRVYPGSVDQLPDPVIEAVEGAGNAPAYRGTAYVVFEDLPLERFGNRVPQFSFEVVRQEQPGTAEYSEDLSQLVRGVALMPGTGEYTLATSPVFYTDGPGRSWAANSNSPSGKTDFETSLETLENELPTCDAASLVVSWFGNDLRCGQCSLVPKVERPLIEGANMPWSVAGLNRSTASKIAIDDDRPIYGGTPSDKAVIEAIRHMNTSGRRVMFYPFILMDQAEGNGLPDPWSGAEHQPHLPWRGRITLSVAPGQAGSPDGTAAADAEVDAFFGSASASDFGISGEEVTYSGPEEWGVRRFILHYASLCAVAGGVDSFCIGSELRGLTQIRGAGGFAAVEHLRSLAADVRQLLGPDTRIGYAADWSEYSGYQPADAPGDRYFHLDPLWADSNIDFVGIDNYMPLSDWRDGDDHSDTKAGWASIYDPEYLQANVEGGEGFDWYYHSPEARDAQIRTPIRDLAHGEDWIWRYKDLRNWWSNPHHERIDGVRQLQPTGWQPQSKPIWFTELGCATVDKGTNQPNKFLDPKSSESSLPRFSNGQRDDLIQVQYLKALLGYWGDGDRNPVSEVYQGPMVDMANAFVWAWDVRPFPAFPNNRMLWGDGANFSRGHWLNGRVGSRTLASVVTEICRSAGLSNVDTSGLFGIVPGYVIDTVGDARSALQPLMLRYGFDAVERDGLLKFVMRNNAASTILTKEDLAETDELEGLTECAREAEAELTGRVRIRFVQAETDHDVVSEEAILASDATHSVSESDLPLAMTRREGRQVAERWLAESRVSQDRIRFALPPSKLKLGVGETVHLPTDGSGSKPLFRIEQVEHTDLQLIEAVRIEPTVYAPSEMPDDDHGIRPFVAPVPVLPLFMDLPLMSGDEVPHAPHLAVAATPWPGSVAVYSSGQDENYALDQLVSERSVIGVTETPLPRAATGLWDNGAPLQVKLLNGQLESVSPEMVLNGGNLAAIGTGDSGNWELFQFAQAEMIAPDTYWLTNRLRGQLGSDGLIPESWPAGSWFVLLDGTQSQLDLASVQRRIARHFRIGPARRGYDDPSYVHLVEAFDGNGLRPYSPCHLRAERAAGGDLRFTWVRRTRIDGDNWDGVDVPLGEETEHYRVRVLKNGAIMREQTVATPEWTYRALDQDADGVAFPATFEIAQISARYGAGLAQSLVFEG